MIIGAQKAGTSSLHHYLSQHSNMVGSRPKEVGYFHRDKYFGSTLETYRKSFRGSRKCLHFEATPEYLYHPNVAAAIHDVYPAMKFIIVLREPGARAYSAWNHYRDHFETGKYKTAILNRPRLPGNRIASRLFENRSKFPSFRECIEIELEMTVNGEGFEPGILRRGLYLEQLEDYWKYFDREQFLLLGFKDLVRDLESTLNKVAGFLEVTPFPNSPIKSEPKNQRKYTEPMSPKDREFLDEYYKIPNSKLFEVIEPLNW
jgi:hypothetical protein